jgi:dTDP-4-dehydrorhamnose reductase
MDKLKILILGDGLMGSYLFKTLQCDILSRKINNFNVDLLNEYSFIDYDIVINCIAYTNTYEDNREENWKINYKFVHDLILKCNNENTKLVHLSTHYIYCNSPIEKRSENDIPAPINTWYGHTKMLGDSLIQLLSYDFLLIRCMHKPKPFPYETAWNDQYGNFDYVDIIGNQIINLINNKYSGIYNIGTNLKNMYELAKLTNENVNEITSPSHVPKNVQVNITKYENINSDTNICI